MLSQLSSGTSLNPTLSVSAPPGLRFYNDVKCVPLVYGNALLEGTIIDDLNASTNYGSAANGYGASLWQAICFGKIALNSVFYDSTLHVLADGSSYDASNFNNGDPVSYDFHIPVIYRKPVGTTSYSLLPYLSALHGISHYFFTGTNAVPWVDSNKNTVKKVRYDVTRILQTGLAVVGDDIPRSGFVLNNYHTAICSFGYGSPGSTFYYIASIGSNIIIKLPTSDAFNSLPNGTTVVFLQPTDYDLPADILPNVPYYLGENVGMAGSDGGFRYLWSDKVGTRKIWTVYPALELAKITTTIAQVLLRNAGNNPASVIFDLLTNKFYGLGLDSTIDINPATGAYSSWNNVDINVTSFWNVLQYFYNNKIKPYGINCTFSEQTTAQEMIKKICEWTDCVLTIDNNGKFYLSVNDSARLYTQGRMGGITLSSLQTVDSNGVPQLSTDDFIDFEPTFKTFDDTVNEFRAKYTSFADSYTNLEVFFRNEANIAETGTTRTKEFDLSGFIYPEIVSTRMNEIAKRESFPLITISTTCKIGLVSALVNDIYKIIHAEYGISDYFKITKKTPGQKQYPLRIKSSSLRSPGNIRRVKIHYG